MTLLICCRFVLIDNRVFQNNEGFGYLFYIFYQILILISVSTEKPRWFAESETCSVLAPVIDMFNHKSNPNAQLFMDEIEDDVNIIIKSRRKISKGEELFLSYGKV
jgi:hypothetical protein